MMAKLCKYSVVLFFLAGQATASSIVIQYSLTPLGSNIYSYTYSVFNNGTVPPGGALVQDFDIEFDTSLYSSLQIETPPSFDSQWSQTIFPGLGGSPALYDVCAGPSSSPTCPVNGYGIPAFSGVTGFSVQFQWLGGVGTVPGPQTFDVYDANSNRLQVGDTVGPEPASFCLAALALCFTAFATRRRRS